MTAITTSTHEKDKPELDHHRWRTVLERQWHNGVAEVTRLSIDLWDGYAVDPTVNRASSEARFDELQVTSQLLAAEHCELRETDAALARLTAGTFGRCERCRSAIPVVRLEAIPQTRWCVGCSSSRTRH